MKKLKLLGTKFIFVLLFCPYVFHGQIVRQYQAANYQSVYMSSPVQGQDIGSTNPSTPYQMYGFNPVTQQYVQLFGPEIMQPGAGYIETTNGVEALMGQTSQLAPYPQQYTGPENTGNISLHVEGNDKVNLLGNPYNGFLDADSFLLDPDNEARIKGPLLLWTNNTAASHCVQGTRKLNFSINDYALYNVLGGVSSGRAITDCAYQNPDYVAARPNGKIYLGTAFFIRGINSGNVVFKESMRDYSINEADAQYFRLAANDAHPVRNSETALIAPPARHRIWINLELGTPPATGPNLNPYRQALVGYAAGATYEQNDRVFDSPTFNSAPLIDIYSIAQNVAGTPKHLAIQGHPLEDTFNCDDFFQLGFKAHDAGTYTFTADSDGMFGGGYGSVPYFISDNGVLHNFPYQVTFAAGESSDTRFRIVFRPIGTQLDPSYCNITLPQIGALIHATYIEDAEMYGWTITNETTHQVGYNETPTLLNSLANITAFSPTVPHNYFLTHNTTYTVKISVKVNGVWYTCGQPCTVTTPPLVINNNAGISCDGVMPFNGQVSCTTAAPYAYSWKVTRSDGQQRAFETDTNAFILFGGGSPAGLTLNNFMRYNTRYCVEVRVKYGENNFGDYAPACCFWTPISGLISDNQGVACSGVLINKSQVSCTSSFAPYSYHWIVTREDDVSRDFVTSLNAFNFFGPTAPSALLTDSFFRYNTGYCIQVQPYYGPNDYGPLSFSCCYTTSPYLGNISINAGVTCGGSTPATLMHQLHAASTPFAPYSVEWQVTRDDTVSVNFTMPTASFNIGTVPDLQGGFLISNRQYCFRVRVKYPTTPVSYSDYGPACCFNMINTGYNRIALGEIGEKAFNVTTSQNPFTRYFSLQISTVSERAVTIHVYDMLGKLLELREIEPAKIDSLQLGQSLPAGFYNVVVSQDENIKSLRVIKI